MAITTAVREDLTRRLLRLRRELSAAGPVPIEPARKDASAVGVADEDEQALTEMLQILASTRNKKQTELLGLIDGALARLADRPGAFGLCEECEEPIAPRRLELMPYVTLCTQCQSERDPRRGVGRRRLTDHEP